MLCVDTIFIMHMCSCLLLPSVPVLHLSMALSDVWHVSECIVVLTVPIGLYGFPCLVGDGLLVGLSQLVFVVHVLFQIFM